jgi:hypothetical protein
MCFEKCSELLGVAFERQSDVDLGDRACRVSGGIPSAKTCATGVTPSG